MDKKLKVGIIGCGSIAAVHIAAYQNNPNVELYALCDIDQARLDAAAAACGVARKFTRCEDMVALSELDMVSVCTWNSAHAPCTIAALKAGKHVLCEKPMAMSAREARQMQEAAQAAGKLLMIGFVRRFGNDCALLEDLIGQDVFGELYYAKASYLRRKGSPGGWFGDKSRSGGGPLIDLGVHIIDLVRYLMGNPKPVSAYGATFHKLGDRKAIKDGAGYTAAGAKAEDVFDVEDLACAMVRFEGGATISIDASFSLNAAGSEQFEIFGTKAGAKVSPELEIFTDTKGYLSNIRLASPTALDFNGLFQKEIDHYVNCVKTGAPCKAPACDGIALMKILDAIYQSAETGHEVVIAD